MYVWLMLIAAIAVNIYGYSLMTYDKRQAQRRGRRIPEKRLFTVAILGGAPGVYLGMKRNHHKTKHASFQILVPAAILWNGFLYHTIFRMVA